MIGQLADHGIGRVAEAVVPEASSGRARRSLHVGGVSFHHTGGGMWGRVREAVGVIDELKKGSSSRRQAGC